jgi:hypothetical protein
LQKKIEMESEQLNKDRAAKEDKKATAGTESKTVFGKAFQYLQKQ